MQLVESNSNRPGNGQNVRKVREREREWNQFLISWIQHSGITLCVLLFYVYAPSPGVTWLEWSTGVFVMLEMQSAVCVFTGRLLNQCLNLASIWAQYGSSMEPIWLQSGGFVRQQPNLSLNRRCGWKKLAVWSRLEWWAVWCGVPLVFR